MTFPFHEHADLQTMLNKLRVYVERKSVCWLTSSILNGLLLRLPVSTKLCSKRGLLIWLTSKRFSKHRSCPNMAYQCGLLVASQQNSWLTASVTSNLRSNRGLLVWLTSKRFSKHRSWPNMAYQCSLLVSQLIYWLTASVTSKLCINRGLLFWLTSKRFSKHN